MHINGAWTVATWNQIWGLTAGGRGHPCQLRSGACRVSRPKRAGSFTACSCCEVVSRSGSRSVKAVVDRPMPQTGRQVRQSDSRPSSPECVPVYSSSGVLHPSYHLAPVDEEVSGTRTEHCCGATSDEWSSRAFQAAPSPASSPPRRCSATRRPIVWEGWCCGLQSPCDLGRRPCRGTSVFQQHDAPRTALRRGRQPALARKSSKSRHSHASGSCLSAVAWVVGLMTF